MTLTTDDGEETHISDALISAGIALFDEMECRTDNATSSVSNMRLLEDEIDSPDNGMYVFKVDCAVQLFLTFFFFSEADHVNGTTSSASVTETEVRVISFSW